MPASSPLGKDIIKDWFNKQSDIKTIIDVGCGEGTYAKLLGPKYDYIGIEIWQPYFKRFELTKYYKKVISGNIKFLINTPLEGDCIIFGDILEHLPEEQVIEILTKAINKFKHIVISIPIGKYEQEEIEGNPYEKHQSTWSFQELVDLLSPTVAELVPYYEGCPPDLGIGVFIR